MFIKKIPSTEQALILASSCINTYKKAVEELVYNALDAESTSIAVRVHIEQASLQVVDNGCGITKKDLNLLGQRYMTSKFADKSNSKSVSNKYGYRGESLANIVEVSKAIRIISRYEDLDATWEKCFHNGKSEKIVEIERRPSKGTTVEIKGLLYNLNIQTKSINQLNELQKIKIFLERIALVHSNISLSLRDDSRNEIVFQLHKNRNICQTISHIYGIDKSEIQELKVQKNQYEVLAFIAKKIKDFNKEWIFLNRKYINNTNRLYKIIKDNLNKGLNNKYLRQKSKIKYDDEEMYLLNNKLPFYLLFIHCPVTDYVICDTLIEFNNWNQITMLLEKLVKFYVGDITIKSVTYNESKKENTNVSEDTREQVKQIINKILASNSKELGVSQMQNGIKGKITKREHKKKHKTSRKLISQNKIATKHNKLLANKSDTNIVHCEKKNMQTNTTHKNIQRKKKKIVYEKLNKTKKQLAKIEQKENKPYLSTKQAHGSLRTQSKTKSNVFINESIIRKFINPSESVKKRCEILARKAQEVLDNFNNRISAGHDDKSIQYSYNDQQYKSIKVNNNTEYKHLYDKILQQHKITNLVPENRHISIKSNYDLLKTITKTQANNDNTDQEYQPLVSHKNKFTNHKNKSLVTSYKVTNTGPLMSKLTYESHNYETIRSKNQKLNKPINKKIISKKSKDCFITSTDDIIRSKVWQSKYAYNRDIKNIYQTFVKDTTLLNINSSLKCSTIQNIEEYSEMLNGPTDTELYNKNITIDEVNTFLTNNTLSNYQTENMSLFIQNTYQHISDNMDLMLDKTQILPKDHTIDKNNLMYHKESIHFNAISHHNSNDSNINIEKSDSIFTERSNGTDGNKITENKKHPKITYISDSQNSRKSNTHTFGYTPMDICETVYLEKEIQNNFNNDYQKDLNINAKPNDIFCDVDRDYQTCNTQFIMENTSHYFNNINNTPNSLKSNTEPGDKANTTTDVIDKKQTTDPVQDNLVHNLINDTNHNEKSEKTNLNTFDLKNRLHFVPKGMSPIFKNCNTKESFLYNLDTDYYHDSLYHNFINEVHANTEIYTENIQNFHDSVSKNIRKNKTRTNLSLHFDGKSLECAKILNQVDNKFIAAIIKNSHNEESSNFLVLFDQHAVHERIRLEDNLSEYVVNEQWKSVPIDSMTIVLQKDEILYLHNYKHKFAQLGLRWTMPSSNDITITGIPEAILGKNPRQADKIMNAVRNLITEQINYIKTQNGCISIYPKSIMDLVFSEACRYAVMFGDKLTRNYCDELLRALSKCKKPFQCAHGRPVMAVLMDFEYNKQEYKANLTKLKGFK